MAKIQSLTHPDYDGHLSDWEKFRYTYEGFNKRFQVAEHQKKKSEIKNLTLLILMVKYGTVIKKKKRIISLEIKNFKKQ